MSIATDPPSKGPQVNVSGSDASVATPKRLVLCFDGTGNRYKGDTSDSNIVKLYQKFDRSDPNQYHYYQPGIGTYSTSEKSVNLGPWGRFRQWGDESIDSGFGTSFDQHVIEGYRFLMRYYDSPTATYDGDKIYIFGFSRGAFTARFLARMISTIGILSKGNKEMVSFAYKSFQDYETRSGPLKTPSARQAYMEKFKNTFCRVNAKVYFLGLFDTVNSVGVLTNSDGIPSQLRTADHIRHAVSIDERRVAFKPALLAQDQISGKNNDEDIKEVFFAGNHGDLGGGWPAQGNDIETDIAEDPVQLSDLPFAWMITALKDTDSNEDPSKRIAFNSDMDVFLNNFGRKEEMAYLATLHDPLKYGGGLSRMKVLSWKFMGTYLH